MELLSLIRLLTQVELILSCPVMAALEHGAHRQGNRINIALFQELWVLGFVVLADLRRVEDNGDGWCGDQARKMDGGRTD